MRKNKIYIFLCAMLAIFVQQACENYDDVVPGEFDTILLLKDSGEQNLTLYDTGDDGNYDITVFKSGNATQSTPKVALKVMDDVELKVYSSLIGREYKAIPSSMYQLENENLDFSSSEQYKKASVVLKTAEIKSFLESNSNVNYVLPIELTKVSTADSINSEKKILILKPNVVTPKVSFAEVDTRLEVSGDEATYQLRLTLPFDSPWDFEATAVVDESALPAGHTIIPTAQYSLKDGGKITFRKGERNSDPLLITLKNSGDVLGASFALPLEIKDITKKGVGAPATPFMLYGAFNAIPLTVEMLSTNAQEPSEGPIANLIDGNSATYFHSAWSVGVSEPHYFQVNIGKQISSVAFTFQNRNNGNGKPQDVKILVSNDGSTWKELKRIDSGMPVEPSSKYTSEVMKSDTPFSYFRFEVQRTNSGSAPTFFNMAEFNMFGK